MLCQVCIGALQHQKGHLSGSIEEADAVFIAHHESVASLESSALEACEVCHPLWSQLTDDEKTKLKGFDPQWIAKKKFTVKPRAPGEKLADEDWDRLVTLCAVLKLDKSMMYKSLGLRLMISVSFQTDFFGEAPLAKRDVRGHYILQTSSNDLPKMTPFSGTTTADQEAWAKALAWLGTCVSEHDTCNIEMRAEPWYPTRLLDLNAVGSNQETIRLVVTSEDPPTRNEKYATLSHCWGAAQFLQLKKASLSSFRNGIKVSEMPKTFRDAIKVTRKLGIRFLWIDSLCILQDKDDLSDWLVEAERMHKVYSYSFCNISAAAALDSSKGLFFDRDPRLSESANLNLCAKGLNMESEYIDCNIVNMHFWDHGVGKCPLNKRGWVLQERLLSPRVLHFGRDQIFWECREHTAAECYPQMLPEIILRNNLGSKFKRLNPKALGAYVTPTGDQLDGPRFYYHVWNSIIKEYSETRLTKGTDKMIALSGIAKYFASVMDDTYVAGMWRKYLASSLLWNVSGSKQQIDGSPSVRPKEYRAPSFSWASVDAMINTARPKDSGLLVEVIDVHLDYVSSDTTGLLKAGYLQLKGSIHPFEMVVNTKSSLKTCFMKVDGTIVKESTKPHWMFGPLVQLDVAQENFDEENSKNTLYYVPVQEHEGPEDHAGYLLLVLVDEAKSEFRRIGIAQTTHAGEIEMLRDATKAKLPGLDLSTGLCTIRII